MMQQQKLSPPAISSAGTRDWGDLDATAIVQELQTDPAEGLRASEAERRLAEHGPNKLETAQPARWHKVLGRQFVDWLIGILVVAAAISLAIGEVTDAITILAIVVLNGLLGFVQEWRAEMALKALERMLSPRCLVVRDSREQEIDAVRLVPGDLVVLEVGDRVPADLRLIETLNLKADESSLTGESTSVNKGAEPVSPDTPLAERSSIAWMGTIITHGRAKGIAVATGMGTEFGRIAQLTRSVSLETTPLQRKLGALGRQLGAVAVVVCFLVALVGWLTGKHLQEMFFTGVAMAVAFVPEGLPAVVTITLALGIRAMVRRRALLRRMQAAETLGAATVICTDKTGTLTQNEMTVQQIWLPAGAVQVTGVGYDPAGHFEVDGRRVDYQKRGDLMALLETGLRCTHAHLYKDEGGWQKTGEPTEAALVVAAHKAWLDPDAAHHVVTEFSFSSERKRMTVVDQHPDGMYAHVKGAPEVILPRCSRLRDSEKERDLTDADLQAAEAAYRGMAEQGLRTLALAQRKLAGGFPIEEGEVERDLTLLGIVGIIDPPRTEVPQAVALAQSAGIRIVMITGDAPATAHSIARRVGLRVGRAITGSEFDRLDDGALLTSIEQGALFARTTPEHKLRLVRCLQQQGHITAMTGDGVNDAPALKKADIGIAMGLRGTDVAKGASDMVLTDDNFASIVGAVEEGRRQYDNIQKFVRYLLSSNTGEIVAIFTNILMGAPLILLPVQILWMNLVTDGLSAVALGVEPAESDVMQHPPRDPRKPILDRSGILLVLLLGGYIGAVTLGLFHFTASDGASESEDVARTMAFTGIVVAEKFNVLNFRSLRGPMVTIGLFSNPWLFVAVLFTFALQGCVVYVPFLQDAFQTVPLSWSDWGLILSVSAPIFLTAETVKWLRWRQSRS